MKGFTATRRYRGATYRIEVKNPDGASKGVKQMLVNGAPISGNVIPPAAPGETVDVTVCM